MFDDNEKVRDRETRESKRECAIVLIYSNSFILSFSLSQVASTPPAARYQLAATAGVYLAHAAPHNAVRAVERGNIDILTS